MLLETKSKTLLGTHIPSIEGRGQPSNKETLNLNKIPKFNANSLSTGYRRSNLTQC